MTTPLDPRDEELLARAADLLRAPTPLAADFDRRVMARVRAEPRPRRRRLAWLVERQAVTVRLRPVWGLAAAAALAALLLVSRDSGQRPGPGEVVVTLVAPFPEARSVAVAGSFSAWRKVPLLRDPETGVFRGRMVVATGVHEYMFVVDGDRWVADPLAESYADDGFGRVNSILVAGRSGT